MTPMPKGRRKICCSPIASLDLVIFEIGRSLLEKGRNVLLNFSDFRTVFGLH
jgi:hypothetical protein